MARRQEHLELPRGVNPIDPSTHATYEALRQQWFELCRARGYQTVEIPPLGFEATFTHGHHAAERRIYRVPDQRGRQLALASDSLPAVLRFAAQRGLTEQRLSYCCPVFRYERRPRRYFHHLGLMDALAQPVSMHHQHHVVRRLANTVTRFLTPFANVHITLTDPGLWCAAITEAELPDDLLNTLRRTTPTDRPELLRRQRAPTALIDVAEAIATNPARPSIPRYDERLRALRELAHALTNEETSVLIDLGELHASEFHDGPAFQIRLQGQSRIIGDGGSYGQFAGRFTPRIPSVFSAIVGLERLAALTPVVEPQTAVIALIAHPTPPTITRMEQLADSMRHRGIAVYDLVKTKRLGAHLRDIKQLRIPNSAVVGPDELRSHTYTVRDHHGTLHNVHHQDINGWLLRRQAERQTLDQPARHPCSAVPQQSKITSTSDGARPTPP